MVKQNIRVSQWGQAELLVDVEIHLEVLPICLFIDKKLITGEVHAFEELSQFFLIFSLSVFRLDMRL